MKNTKIAIIGPSSSGKSTLAAKLAAEHDLPLLHLDQIAHVPHTNWQRRPDSELIAAQKDFIEEHDQWIIEGNYSVCMPERLAAATHVIWCDPPLWGSIWRYIKRSLINNKNRHGRLEGARGEFSLKVLKYTIFNYPRNARKYHTLLAEHPHLKITHLKSFTDIRDFSC